MNDNNLQPNNSNNNQDFNNNQRPVFLSSENPDVLMNPEVKVIQSNNNQVPTGQYNQVQEPSINLNNIDSHTYQPVSTSNNNYPNTQNSLSNPLPPPVEPVRETIVKEKIIYKDSVGNNFLGGILHKLFNCVGCVLFIISVIIIAFVFIINF